MIPAGLGAMVFFLPAHACSVLPDRIWLGRQADVGKDREILFLRHQPPILEQNRPHQARTSSSETPALGYFTHPLLLNPFSRAAHSPALSLCRCIHALGDVQHLGARPVFTANAQWSHDRHRSRLLPCGCMRLSAAKESVSPHFRWPRWHPPHVQTVFDVVHLRYEGLPRYLQLESSAGR